MSDESTMPATLDLLDVEKLPNQPPAPAVEFDENPLPGKLTEVGYVLPARLSRERYTSLMRTLARISKSHQWWVGDAALYGEARWGETYYQLLQETDYKYGTLRNIASVCRRFPIEKRRPDVPFSHYQSAMSLAGRSPAAAAKLIEHAQEQGKGERWVREQSEVVRNQLDEQDTANGVTPAPRPTPLDRPRLTFGQHRPACPTCSCPVVEDGPEDFEPISQDDAFDQEPAEDVAE